MPSQFTSASIWTPANVVTCIRILFIPVFYVLLLFKLPLVAVIIFALLAATDWLDGYLARSRNEVTNFGKFMDPIADKLLVLAALLALIELGSMPSWIALVIVTREFLVSGLRMLAASEGVVIAASKIGKAKTATTLVALILFMIKEITFVVSNPVLFQVIVVLAWILMVIAVILTIYSMYDYFKKSAHLLLEAH